MTPADPGLPRYAASIVIPAHNEERTIGRLLIALRDDQSPSHFEIIVVCNGCTDRTAHFAQAMAPDATVIEIDQPSKKAALKVGDRQAVTYPRVFVDADVEIRAADVRHLIHPLTRGRVLATAPRRVLPRIGVGWPVRCYYDVWERLPQVQSGLFGRGVIALSKEGNDRVQRLPQVMSDDLAISEAFMPYERVIVEDAVVVVHPPRTIKDLIRRRTRVVTGNAEADKSGLRGSAAKTSLGMVVRIALAEPRMLLRVPVFFGVTLFSRLVARKAVRSGDFTTWKRDESSRS